MAINLSLLDITDYNGNGYKPLVDYGEWRVAILRWAADMLPANIDRFQRHNETDEIFVLLAGRCILFIGVGEDKLTEIFAEDMEPLKLYNVKRGAWHFHTLSDDAVVLIVENRNTDGTNSDDVTLTADQRAKLADLTRALWATTQSR